MCAHTHIHVIHTYVYMCDMRNIISLVNFFFCGFFFFFIQYMQAVALFLSDCGPWPLYMSVPFSLFRSHRQNNKYIK